MANEAPKKASKQEVKKEQVRTVKGYVHVDTFLDYAGALYGLNKYQLAGFRAFMIGKEYQYEDKDFVPFLEKYIGKEV
nr:MAG TPA: hypothetical protein [Herelleviridae sp.]